MSKSGKRLEYVIVWRDSQNSLGLSTFKDESGQVVSVALNPSYVHPDSVLQSLEQFTGWLTASRNNQESAFVQVDVVRDWLGWDIAPVEDEEKQD